MVFESLLTDLLNKYLGQYVENLDASQLKVGIWGGNVALENLRLKPSTFDELNLPVKTIHGHCGKLTLQIPWNNLYNAPVNAEVENVYMLVIPNSDIKYDPAKEEKWKFDEKMAQVKKVEEAKMLEREREKPKTPEATTFVEKLGAQIIKNVQIKFKNIHIRFEDRTSNPGKTYAAGITLDSLIVKTVASWGDPVTADPMHLIFKELTMSCLAVYWNPSSPVLFSNLNDLNSAFNSGIARIGSNPKDYKYILGPINAVSRLRINVRPDLSNFIIPKVLLDADFKTLSISISKNQYQDVMSLLEALELMRRAGMYRKYRPNVPSYKDHYKEWWRFAYECIVEEDVKRKQRNWNWKYILNHRNLCKSYAEAYRNKITASKSNANLNKACEELERQLDAFNIVLIRQRVEFDVQRQVEAKEAQKAQQQKQEGWLSRWWSGGSSQTDESEPGGIIAKLEGALSNDEREKLFKAIGYKEGDKPLVCPQAFIEQDFKFVLHSLEISVCDDDQVTKQALKLELSGVRANVLMLPTSMRVSSTVQVMVVDGLEQGGVVPKMVTVRVDQGSPTRSNNDPCLLDIFLELNPVDNEFCSTRVRLKAEPLLVVYDAQTVIALQEIFDTRKNLATSQIQSAVQMKLLEIKTMSTAGLQHMIQEHKVVDLNIEIKSSLLVLPKNGFYVKGSDSELVVSLGHIKITTKPIDRSKTNAKELMDVYSYNTDEAFKTLMTHSYDHYDLKLKDLQVVYALKGESYENPNQEEMYFLKPTTLLIGVGSCIIKDDPRLPHLKASGQLNKVSFGLSYHRLQDCLGLLVSIPLGQKKDVEPLPFEEGKFESTQSLSVTSAMYLRNDSRSVLGKSGTHSLDEVHQFTELQLDFQIQEITFKVAKSGEELIAFRMHTLTLNLIKETFDQHVSVQLGGLIMNQNYEGQTIQILDTPGGFEEGKKNYLLSAQYVMVDRKSPDFHVKYGSVLQKINVDFTKLDVLMHCEALLNLMQHANDFISILKKPETETQERTTSRLKRDGSSRMFRGSSSRLRSTSNLPRGRSVGAGSKKSGSRRSDVIDFKADVNIGEILVKLANKTSSIMSFGVTGGEAGITMRKAYSVIYAQLKMIELCDLGTEGVYNKIVSVMEDTEAVKVNVVMFNGEQASSKSVDFSIKGSFARLRVIFKNRFVMSVLDFLGNFQAAQQALVEASQAAAEAAKQNVQEAYSNATRAELDLKLQAPLIVVPINEDSLECFVLDLGSLVIDNTLIEVAAKSSDEPAILDRLKLNLENLKLFRAVLSKDLTYEKEFQILKPVTFRFTVQRNLSCGWFTDVPDLELACKIPSINIHLSRKSYLYLMRMLNENLGSVPESTSKPPQKKQLTQKPPSMSNNMRRIPEGDEEKDDLDKSTRITTDSALANMKFSCSLEKVVIDLGIPTDDDIPNEDLARLTLDVISLRGSILTDGSIQMAILLVDLTVQDLRASQGNKINVYMYRKLDTSESSQVSVRSDVDSEADDEHSKKTMLDIVYQQTKDATFANVRVCSFTMILNVNHLMKIAAVFAAPDNQPQKPGLPAVVPIEGSKPKPSKSASVTATPQHVAQPSSAVLNFNLKCEQPDIILVESMDNIDTNALIMHAQIHLQAKLQGSQQFISGSMNDLQLFSCCYNPSKRNKTKVPVLHPFTVSIAGASPDDQGLHLDVNATDITLSVSPGTICLLSNISSAMSSTPEDQDALQAIEDINRTEMWAATSYKVTDYYFLRAGLELAEDAGLALEEPSLLSPTEEPKSELCICSVPSIVIMLESGTGKNTLPLLLFQSSVQAVVRNWSSLLNAECQLTLQMSYYNHTLALWEPVLEPVETVERGKELFSPWELSIQVETSRTTSANDSFESTPDIKPQMYASITSKDNLPLTVTKTSLDVFKHLSDTFSAAYYNPMEFEGEKPAFTVINDSGLQVTVELENSSFKVWGQTTETADRVVLDHKARVELNCPKAPIRVNDASESEKFIYLRIELYDCDITLPVSRADKRFFRINHRSTTNDQWGIVSEVTVENGVTYVTLRSILQVRNRFNVPISVYYMTKKGNELKLVGVVDPKDRLNIPLAAVYTPTSELFFSVQGYSLSLSPFIWKDLQQSVEKTILMKCDPKQVEDKEPFFIRATGELEQVFFENTARHTMLSSCYNIYIRPTIIFKNFLPIQILCCVQGMALDRAMKPGESIQVPTAEPGSSTIVVRIPDYLDKEWVRRQEIQENAPELEVWTFESYETTQRFTLELGLHTVHRFGTIIMELYCPFWMLNKTGLLLCYKRSSKASNDAGDAVEQADDPEHVLYHPANYKGPIMFSFRAKSFFAKKKSQIRVQSGPWSDKFSLDVAGSSGSVVCTTKWAKYEIGVSIQLTYSTFTKQVIFTPFYVVINKWPCEMECQEVGRPTDPWMKIPKNDCLPFWPISKTDEGIRVRVEGTNESTICFPYNRVHESLFKLNNKYGAVHVDVQMTEGGTYIALAPYEVGMAPALIINDLDSGVQVYDKSKKDVVTTLKAGHQVMFTWDNVSPEQELLFSNEKQALGLRHDGIGSFIHNGKECYWSCFLYGLQRVLLFTFDKHVAVEAQSAGEKEGVQFELETNINGISLSLVDNISKVEVVHLGITSTGVAWQSKKKDKKRFKPLSERESSLIEQAYQNYLRQIHSNVNKPNPQVQIDTRISVDFVLLKMTKPVHRDLKRAFKTGLWMDYVTTPHTAQFHLKINRIQIDNQTYDCVFPVVLAPVPPPRSIVADATEKPFVEVSVVKRLTDFSVVQQFKYFKVLVQEFHIKVDIGFVNALMKMFEEEESKNESAELDNFNKDLSLRDEPLQFHVKLFALQDQKHFYDYLHLSPLKIHLSFTLSGGGQEATGAPPVIDTLLQSFGVTLTDVQGVVFKLAFFERDFCFMTKKQLASEVQTHYVGALLKQIYVLVLGLDVIGNPFGLVMGLGHGAKDLFYEPFQGAIQGPGEFATGLAYGVRSLFGHTVGGAAGAVSKITGAMGKGLAALTFDKEYQKSRREMYSQQPANIQEGLAQSSKGLVMGVFHGVTGVITKPISGAKEDGVQGFFKGAGKGLVGLVTRPTAGLVDFASGSFNAVKRATDLNEDITRMRPPRYIGTDGLVKPYSKRLADGYKLLMEVEKGKFSTTDLYVYHIGIGNQDKDILMLTDQRISYITANDIFGGYQIEWSHTWNELIPPASLVDNGVCIILGRKKGVKTLFQSSESAKILLVENLETRKLLEGLINDQICKMTTPSPSGSLSASDSVVRK